MNRFKNPKMREIYDLMIKLANDPDSELYVSPNGIRMERRGGASHRNSFWAGVDGLNPIWNIKGTIGYACWRAGVDFGKSQELNRRTK